MTDTRKIFVKPSLITATATPEPLDGVGCLAFLGKVWLWGGWNGHTSPADRNTIYSWDGSSVTTHSNAPWNPSHSFGCALDTTTNTVYKMGSDAQAATTAADRGELWKTTDGTTWTLVASNLSFMLDRVLFGYVIDADGNQYVLGGQQVSGSLGSWVISAASLYTDVWKSTDGGLTWTQIATGQTHLGGNLSGQCFIWEGKIYVVCAPSKNDNTAANRTFAKGFYSSTDGVTWTQLADFPGRGRGYGAVGIWRGLPHMIGGVVDNGADGANASELWYYNGESWQQYASIPLYGTHATGICPSPFSDDDLIIWGGSQDLTNKALWKYSLVDKETYYT
jgi:hypothetical protein